MNKHVFPLILTMLLTGCCFRAFSQNIPNNTKKLLAIKEDSLRNFSDSMINAQYNGKRFTADSHFVRTFVRALQVKNSFYYPFESLSVISQLYAPDSSFRIFTWQLKKDEYMYLQKGAIQMNTPDGSLKLFPLFDASMFTSKPQDSVRSRANWIGAIYYKIVAKEYQGKKFYTLLGFDDYSVASNRKWMEVLSFNTQGEPVFGGPYISFKEDTAKVKPVMHRFYIEYKKEASTTFNYNPELDMIIYDHLISETDQPERRESYIPDGDFEGFKWQKGQWVHVNEIFDFRLQDGQFPVEQAIRDADGNLNEKKLMEQSEKNIKNAPKKPASPSNQ